MKRMLVGKPVLYLSEIDFSKFISEIYGRPYCLQQQGDGLPQNTLESFYAPTPNDLKEDPDSGQPTLGAWMAAKIDPMSSKMDIFRTKLFWEREFYPPLWQVVDDLVERGLLKPGEYILHIWW